MEGKPTCRCQESKGFIRATLACSRIYMFFHWASMSTVKIAWKTNFMTAGFWCVMDGIARLMIMKNGAITLQSSYGGFHKWGPKNDH